ncbi:hypothetical protein OJ963_40545 [Streptomyces sp. RS2]|uniref:hypothetical protein n=1 Tax=Streptomyces sp. RS2 TaxID=1451205 RepID=UPI0021F892B4|nr:hypothetical protein [Streptomyces sp. RS2]MCW1100082.1 hypothetical protein [Streptomyces sp. RS2]
MYGKVLDMPTPEFPAPMLDAVQRAAEALSGSDSMQAVLESVNHVANSQAAVLNTAINAQTEMLGQDWADHVSHAWDAAGTTWHDHVTEASEALSRSTQHAARSSI